MRNYIPKDTLTPNGVKIGRPRKPTPEEQAVLDFNNLKVSALTSFWDFVDLINLQNGGKKKFSVVHEELCNFVQEDTNAPYAKLILMPRGHAKSTLCSVAYVLWRIYLDPSIRILIGCKDKKLPKKIVRQIRNFLENETLQETVWHNRPHIAGRLIPEMNKRTRANDDTEAADRKIVWTTEEIRVIHPRHLEVKESTVTAISVGTSGTGEHYDLVLLDDLFTFVNANSKTKREGILEWIEDSVSILDPFNPDTGVGGQLLVLGTRYYQDDYYGLILEKLEKQQEVREEGGILDEDDISDFKVFNRNVYKNGIDKTDGYLWPERFNDKNIAKIRRGLSDSRWASQYLNQVITDEQRIFKKEFIQWKVEGRDYRLGEDKFIHMYKPQVDRDTKSLLLDKDGNTIPDPKSIPTLIKPFIVVDPAVSTNLSADPTVITVGGKDLEDNLYIFDMRRGRWILSDIVKNIFAMITKWKCRYVTVETVAAQQYLVQVLKEASKQYGTIGIDEYRPVGEKRARIQDSVERYFTAKKFYMTNHVGAKREFVDAIEGFIDEINYFPKSRHDDCLDTISMLVDISIPTRKSYVKKGAKEETGLKVNPIFGGTR